MCRADAAQADSGGCDPLGSGFGQAPTHDGAIWCLGEESMELAGCLLAVGLTEQSVGTTCDMALVLQLRQCSRFCLCAWVRRSSHDAWAPASSDMDALTSNQSSDEARLRQVEARAPSTVAIDEPRSLI